MEVVVEVVVMMVVIVFEVIVMVVKTMVPVTVLKFVRVMSTQKMGMVLVGIQVIRVRKWWWWCGGGDGGGWLGVMVSSYLISDIFALHASPFVIR